MNVELALVLLVEADQYLPGEPGIDVDDLSADTVEGGQIAFLPGGELTPCRWKFSSPSLS